MADLIHVRDRIIGATYREVLPGKFDSTAATVLLLAIGLQESRFEHRQQIGGPARSYWQGERRGGMTAVLNPPATSRYARAACLIRGVLPTADAVYAAFLDDDLLGCAMARLLLYSDPRSLPAVGDVAGAWAYYLSVWRPGKPHPRTWAGLYAQALEALV